MERERERGQILYVLVLMHFVLQGFRSRYIVGWHTFCVRWSFGRRLQMLLVTFSYFLFLIVIFSFDCMTSLFIFIIRRWLWKRNITLLRISLINYIFSHVSFTLIGWLMWFLVNSTSKSLILELVTYTKNRLCLKLMIRRCRWGLDPRFLI